MKRAYRSPQSWPTEVAFEEALLVNTARLVLEIDELENVNKTAGSDNASYFEFEF